MPATDSDCYFDYHAATCAPQEYCGYSYNLGDYTLSQSCRIVKRPPDQQNTADEELATFTEDEKVSESQSSLSKEDGNCIADGKCENEPKSSLAEPNIQGDPCANGDNAQCREKIKSILDGSDQPCKIESLLGRVEQCKSKEAGEDEFQHCLSQGKELCACIDSAEKFRTCMAECLPVARTVLCSIP